MDLYDTDQFSVKSSSPKQVAINERLYVELHKTLNDTKLKMVVENCWATDTSDQSGELKYAFLNDGCGLDTTFVKLREDASYYRFKINAFVFIKLKSQTYLHCSLYVCDASASDVKCQQGCQNRRKRRAIEEATIGGKGGITEETMTRKRRAVSSASPLAVGQAVSSLIQYTAKPTCATTHCPTNANCIEGYPAFCRCIGNRVMDIYTKRCTGERLAEMKVSTQLTWVGQYEGPNSSEFLLIARLFEDKMLDYYVTQRKVSGIRGIKIVSASKNDDGAVEFRVMMILATDTTMERVSQQIQALLATKAEEVAKQISVNPSTSVMKLVPVYIPVQNGNNGQSVEEETHTWLTGAAVAAAVLILLLLVFAFYIRDRRLEKSGPELVDVQGMEMGAVKVES